MIGEEEPQYVVGVLVEDMSDPIPGSVQYSCSKCAKPMWLAAAREYVENGWGEPVCVGCAHDSMQAE